MVAKLILGIFLTTAVVWTFSAAASGNDEKTSDLDSSNFFWLKRDSISYPDLFRKKLARKHLKQLINHKKKKSLRRKQAQLLKNRILPSELPKRPNIILMMADDQDTELGSLQFMPKLNRYLREEGAEFKNGFVTTPMCCPSRSSILTGLYAHNHHVLTNNDNCSSTEWVQQHEPRSFAKYLNDAGYTTGYFGKYLNKYNGNHIPVGWDEWNGLVRNSRFYNYTLNVNGNKVRHGWDYAQDYFPDLITNDSLAFFRRAKQRQPNRPIMMVLSYPGPHGPEDSAPQYKDLFFNVTTHHTPAYDWAPNPDKQWILQVTDRMEPIHKKFTDVLMTKRLQTLQSIDEAIERLYHELDSLGELENSYIFYTSDHGYHLGQYGLVKGKAFPFDVDTKVPFLVKGPGIRGGSLFQQPVLNIDLAPTFLDIAGVSPPEHMDGKSIVPLFHESDDVTVDPEPSWRQAFLIERGKMTEDRFAKIRHTISHLANHSISSNGSAEVPYRRLSRQELLAVECVKPKFQDPCQPDQRRKCVQKKNGNWKTISCQTTTLRSLLFSKEHDSCNCQEKRLQKKFIAKHVSRKLRHNKFVINNRSRRSTTALSDNVNDADHALKEIAAEEIDEVDIIMEDINDEIADLQESITNSSLTLSSSTGSLPGGTSGNGNGNGAPCSFVNKRQINCNSSVYTDKIAWRTSRAYVNEQIRQLRAQLGELKEIRSHLKAKRPNVYIEYPADIDMADLDGDLLQIEGDLIKPNNQQPEKPAHSRHCNCKSKRNRSLLRSLRRTRRQKIKMARLRQRLRRKMLRQKKKDKSKKKMEDSECSPDERLNCFSHNNEHWKTPPFWNDGSFCACTNSNTNTYSCVRNVNGTHNYLYCEFVSGLITYYNLKVDPYQLRNIYLTLSTEELNFMHHQLAVLKNHGLKYSRMYSTFARQRSFIKRYGQFLPPMEAYQEDDSYNPFIY